MVMTAVPYAYLGCTDVENDVVVTGGTASESNSAGCAYEVVFTRKEDMLK